MAVANNGIELESVFGGFGPVGVLFFLNNFFENGFDLVTVEFSNGVESGFFGKGLHDFGGPLPGILWDGFSGLEIKDDREEYADNEVILKLIEPGDKNLNNGKDGLKSLIVVIKDGFIVGQDFGKFFDMILEPFAGQEHVADHVQQRNSVFGVVLELLLGQDIHHQRDVIRRLDMVANNRNKF